MRETVQIILAMSFIIIGLGGCAAVEDGSESFEGKYIENKWRSIMYKKLTTNMVVEDVNSTVDFYKDVLGFEFVIGVPENSQDIVTHQQKGQKLCFAVMKYGSVEMMFQTKESLAKEIPEFDRMDIGGSVTFYIDVDDVKELYEKLKDKVTIVLGLETKFYGKQEFYIRDCNGYILGFAGEI